jgi:hypothetical protein
MPQCGIAKISGIFAVRQDYAGILAVPKKQSFFDPSEERVRIVPQ